VKACTEGWEGTSAKDHHALVQRGQCGLHTGTEGNRNRAGGNTDHENTWEMTEAGCSINAETRPHRMPLGGTQHWEKGECISEAIVLVGSKTYPMNALHQLETCSSEFVSDEDKVAGLAPEVVAGRDRKRAWLMTSPG
jgi:hypothetical protein